MSFTIKVDNLDRVLDEFKKAPLVVAKELENGVKGAGLAILQTEKKEAPVKTGNLRRSIEMVYKPISVSIYPKSAYSYFVHFGTGLYGERKALIRPIRAKALAWKSGGRMIFAKSTRGQKPNPFVERTAKAVEPEINRIFDEVLNNITNKI